MVYNDHSPPLGIRFYSFGSGEKDVEIMDARIIEGGAQGEMECTGGTVLKDGKCVEDCHPECDGELFLEFCVFMAFEYSKYPCFVDSEKWLLHPLRIRQKLWRTELPNMLASHCVVRQPSQANHVAANIQKAT